MDVIFETLDFTDRIILPASSEDTGYISMNGDIEFCGGGSFELVFRDKEVEEFIKTYRNDGLLLTWGKFQGYLTDYQFTKNKKSAYGSHINSLLHKYVVKPRTISGDLKEAVYNIIDAYTPFTIVESNEDFGTVEFETDECQNLDKFLISLLQNKKLGYKLYIENKVIYFELLKPVNNPLELSEGNLNVYEVQEDFSNKELAYGGWYKKTKENDGTEVDPAEWTYISLQDVSGISKRNIVLSASSPREALKELAEKTVQLDISCKTRNLVYGEDYNLGDIVRYSSDGLTVQKQISQISLWFEGSAYHEEPKLTE